MKSQKGCEGVWDMVSCLCPGRREGVSNCSPVMEKGLWAAGSPNGVGKEDLTSQEMSVEQVWKHGGSPGLLQRAQSIEPDPLPSHISYDNFTNANPSVL